MGVCTCVCRKVATPIWLVCEWLMNGGEGPVTGGGGGVVIYLNL